MSLGGTQLASVCRLKPERGSVHLQNSPEKLCQHGYLCGVRPSEAIAGLGFLEL